VAEIVFRNSKSMEGKNIMNETSRSTSTDHEATLNVSIIQQQKEEKRSKGIKYVAIGIILLIVAIIIVVAAHTIVVFLFIAAGISLIMGVIYLISNPDETDVNIKRQEAEELRKTGDVRGAEQLKQEAAVLHEALKHEKE
jgi:predicted membrane channel-forming protein YqfA (hemolysin III family)